MLVQSGAPFSGRYRAPFQWHPVVPIRHPRGPRCLEQQRGISKYLFRATFILSIQEP